jgi:hypothetical protein
MEQFLTKINQAGGMAELTNFLRSHYPHSIVETNNEWDRLFNSGILTYPKRKILFGPPEELSKIIAEFVSDKITYEAMIIDNRAYVEYLDKGDEHLSDQIPAQKWLIRTAGDHFVEKKHG